MLTRTLPEIGCWYENNESGAIFEVVAIDEQGAIATRHVDGEIEEVDTEIFIKAPLRPIEQPEDWGAPFEVGIEDRDESDFFSRLDDDDQDTDIESDYMRLID